MHLAKYRQFEHSVFYKIDNTFTQSKKCAEKQYKKSPARAGLETAGGKCPHSAGSCCYLFYSSDAGIWHSLPEKSVMEERISSETRSIGRPEPVRNQSRIMPVQPFTRKIAA